MILPTSIVYCFAFIGLAFASTKVVEATTMLIQYLKFRKLPLSEGEKDNERLSSQVVDLQLRVKTLSDENELLTKAFLRDLSG